MIDVISGPNTAADYPTRAPNAKAAGTDVLQLWQLIRVMEGNQPAKGTAERRIYDHAMKKLSEGEGATGVRNYLHGAMRVSLTRLSQLAHSPSDVGDMADPIRKVVTSLSKRDHPHYRPDDVQSKLSGLTEVLGTGRPVDGLARPEPSVATGYAGTPAAPTIFMPQNLMGRENLLSMRDKSIYSSIRGDVSDIVAASFGRGQRATAQSFVDFLSNAYAAEKNNESPSVGTSELLSVLEQITNPSIKNDPDFERAMDFLKKGQRKEALDALNEVHTLKTALKESGSMAKIVFNKRGYDLFTTGGDYHYYCKNNSDWLAYVRSSGVPVSGLIHWSAGLHYSLFNLMGERQFGTYDIETDTFTPQGESERFRGTGHTLLAKLGLSFGSEISLRPVEWRISTEFGYRHVDMEPDSVELPSGTKRTTKRKVNEFYMGVTKVEVILPHVGTEKRPMIRMTPERIGFGWIPGGFDEAVKGQYDPANLANFLAYATWPVNWKQEGLAITSAFTPQFSYLLQQFRSGIEVHPIQLHKKWTNDMALSTSLASVKLDYNSDTDVLSILTSGQVIWRITPGITLSGQFGYGTETGGESWNRLPGSIFGRVGLGIAFGMTPDKKAPISSLPVPTRRLSPVKGDAETSYLGATRWLDGAVRNPAGSQYLGAIEWLATAKPEDVTGDIGQDRAKKLATNMDSQAASERWRFTSDSNYTAGLGYLRAGELRKGIAALRRVPAFTRAEEVSGKQGQDRAKELARYMVQQQVTDRWNFTGDKNYIKGRDLLDRGKLREGIGALRLVPAFRNMEQAFTATPPTEGQQRR
jgi:hypothetical protein